MSDVGIRLDGLLALLAVLAADGILLFSFALCAALGWVRSRRMKVPVRSLPIYRHMTGSLVCVIICSAAAAVIFLYGETPPPRPLLTWSDRWIPLWLPTILLVWPVTVAVLKKRHVVRQQGRR